MDAIKRFSIFKNGPLYQSDLSRSREAKPEASMSPDRRQTGAFAHKMTRD